MKFKTGDLIRHQGENEEWLEQVIKYHSTYRFTYNIIAAPMKYSSWVGENHLGNETVYKLVESTPNHPHTNIFK